MTKGTTKTKAQAKAKKEVKYSNLFESTPRSFRVGAHIQPKRDMTRFVKWPKYILLQRQKRILYKRLKVPGLINQFTHTLSADKAKALFKLLSKYQPESPAEKKARLLESAKQATVAKKTDESKKPKFIKCGLNHVTTLVEQKKAKLVVIAHDVDPVELVMWLPTLCKAKNVPYCFVKSKARLGQLVNQKTTTCLAFTDVRKEDLGELEKLATFANQNYNQNKEQSTAYGQMQLGGKAQTRIKREVAAKEAEQMNKL